MNGKDTDQVLRELSSTVAVVSSTQQSMLALQEADHKRIDSIETTQAVVAATQKLQVETAEAMRVAQEKVNSKQETTNEDHSTRIDWVKDNLKMFAGGLVMLGALSPLLINDIRQKIAEILAGG